MIWNPFKPKPKSIIQTRASSKAQREADRDYAKTHTDLARDVNRPVPSHLQGRGR